MGRIRDVLLVLLGVVMFAPIVGTPALNAAESEHSQLVVETHLGPQVFWVEVARTVAERQRGLMFRRILLPDRGMLFDYGQTQEISMWMKDTYVPLDMVFIAGDGRVVHVVERTVPLSLTSIPSQGPVRAVLELTAGSVERLDIRLGDRVLHAVFGNAN